jgi:plasmid stability protein
MIATEVFMPQILVRNLDAQLKTRLQRRAKRNGRSMEAEVRDILRNTLKEDEPRGGLGSEIAALFKDCGLDEPIQEIHGKWFEPLDFGS